MNAVIQKALDAIRGYKHTVEKEIDNLEAERESLKRERDLLIAAPRPRDEVLADLENMIDMHRGEYARRLIRWLSWSPLRAGWIDPSFRLRPPPTELNAPSINLVALPPDNESVDAKSISALCLVGLLGDAMKPAVRGVVEAMEWPPGAVPAAERQNKVADLDARIKGLSERIAALLKESEEVGIQF